MFSRRFAGCTAARYRRRGLGRAPGAIVSFPTDRSIDGATVLEVGGGVGYLHIDLLRRGAAKATNLEISTSYEPEAARLLAQFDLVDRVERRILDMARTPDAVDPADVVVMHEVVCCYADYERLIRAAASKANQYLLFSHPPRNMVSRALIRLDNAPRVLRGDAFPRLCPSSRSHGGCGGLERATPDVQMEGDGVVRGRARALKPQRCGSPEQQVHRGVEQPDPLVAASQVVADLLGTNPGQDCDLQVDHFELGQTRQGEDLQLRK